MRRAGKARDGGVLGKYGARSAPLPGEIHTLGYPRPPIPYFFPGVRGTTQASLLQRRSNANGFMN
jgi:hypothetical protein